MPKTVGKVPELRDVERIGKVYDTAGRKLRSIFLSVNPIDFKSSNIPSLNGEIESIVNGLDRSVFKWGPPSAKDAFNEAYGINKTRAIALGFEEDQDWDLDNNERAIESFREAMIDDLLKANQTILVGAQQYFQALYSISQGSVELKAFWDMRDEEVISELLDDAIREGKSRQYLRKKILEYFKSLFGELQFIRINNRNYQMGYYAKMVARTRLRTLQSQATVNAANQFRMDLVEISNHGTTTPICKKYEGKVFSLSGNTKSVDGRPVGVLTERPPFHPNCWHNMKVTSERAIRIRKKYGQE